MNQVTLNLELFNEFLSTHQMPMISQQTLDTVLSRESPTALIRAMTQSVTQPNAVKFIKRALRESGVDLDNASNSANMPPGTSAVPSGGTDSPQRAPSQPPSSGAPETSSQRPNEDTSKFPDSLHVYGGKGALDFKEDETRSNPPFPTIRIEAALATGHNSRSYNWDSKVSIQVTRTELPVVTAAFLGLIEGCEFKSHGEGKNKGFSIQNQGDKFFISVNGPGVAVPVPVSPSDAAYVASLCIKQLRRSQRWLTGGDIVMWLGRTVGRMQK